MIEDRPENIVEIAKKIPVICYNNVYNKNISNKNVYRCFSWYDIYNKINNLDIINLIKFKICRRKNARIFLQERI